MPSKPPISQHTTPLATCPGCSAAILWAITPDGTRLPLDLHAPVYLLRVNAQQNGCVVVDKHIRAYAAHSSTCVAARAGQEVAP